MTYLYRLAFPNGKLYIGITEDPAKRWRTYLRDARYPKRIVERALSKHGIANVVMEVLVVGPRDYVLELERSAIAAWRTRDPEVGYNVHLGGRASIASAPETRLKMSASQRIRKRAPEEYAALVIAGRAYASRGFTEEHRRRLSEAASRRVPPKPNERQLGALARGRLKRWAP